MMLFVTTCSAAGFDEYGHRLLETFDNAPGRMIWYADDFAVKHPRIEQRPTPKAMQAFKVRHSRYEPVSWRWDVVKFAHKVYAVADAFADHEGMGIWIDADTVIHKPIPDGTLEQFLPPGMFMSMFKRAGMYTETGLWLMDCAHTAKQQFLKSWIDLYESERFKMLPEWHDCMTLDATVRAFEKRGLIETFSLSGKHERQMHPMASSPLGEWFDHCKGPRKVTGRSPENAYR
jgi:hypothetical protein